MNEQQLTKAIIDLLTACGWYVIRTHRPGQWATQPGVSDLIAVSSLRAKQVGYKHFVANPVVAFIEVKGPRAKLKPEQQAFLQEMSDRGHIAFVADSIETVVDGLGLNILL